MSAFKNRDFRFLTQARFLFVFAIQVQAVVIGWQVYEIMKDPLYLGLIGLAEAIPAMTLALLAGHIVDRSNPLTIYKNVIRLTFVSAAILFVVSGDHFGIHLNGHQRLPWIYTAAFVTGLARGFSQPSLYALIPQIIPRHVLSVSSAWITSAFQIAAVTGPAVGGVLYAWKGVEVPYAMDCAMLIASSISLLFIRIKPKVNPLGNKEPFSKSVATGIRFVFGHQLLLSALALDMFAVLFGGATAVLPIFAGEILRVGPQGLGILRAAPALGALLGSAFMIQFQITRSAGKILVAVVSGFGLCIVGFALSTSLWLSVAFLALSGTFDSISMVIRTTIVQLCSPEDMRGRVSSVNSIFILSSNELGAFESGVAAKLMGTVPSVVFGGCMTLVTVAAAAVLAPKLRKMDISKL